MSKRVIETQSDGHYTRWCYEPNAKIDVKRRKLFIEAISIDFSSIINPRDEVVGVKFQIKDNFGEYDEGVYIVDVLGKEKTG